MNGVTQVLTHTHVPDCRRGQSLIVHAINEGRQVAREIDAHLMNKSSLAGPGGIVQLIKPPVAMAATTGPN